MLPAIFIEFLAETLCCLTNDLVFLKAIDMVLYVLDDRKHKVDGRVVLAIQLVGHLLNGFEEGHEFLHEGKVILSKHQVFIPVTIGDNFVEGFRILLVDPDHPLHHVHVCPPASHHIADHLELHKFVQLLLGID